MIESWDSDAPPPRHPTATHVDLLGGLFMVWGVLTTLIGVSTLSLGIAAAALISSGRAGASPIAARVTAATFTTLAILAIVWGIVHVVMGALIRRRRHWSRHVALALGTVDLLLLPYGTALGAYSLWTLLRADARKLFEA